MYRKFEVLSDDKKLRIINACLAEFSKKQFKEASTDLIAQNAEISKGALFQYFGTKRQLYLYVFNYSYDLMKKDMWEQIDTSNPDLLDRMKEIYKLEMVLYAKHPDLYEFLLNSYSRETDASLKEATFDRINGVKSEWYGKILENVDYSKFRPDLPANQIVSIIFWTLEGYGNSEAAKLKNETLSTEKYDHWMVELDGYINTLKKAFYKED